MVPDRFKIYTISYIISILVYILGVFGSLSTSLLFLSFVLSSFFLVFTFEVLPKENLDKPQVHYYEKSRLNSYSYYMIILFISAALLYYLLSGILRLDQALSIIVVWPICIYFSILIFKRTSPNLESEIIFDYVTHKLKVNPTYEEAKLLTELIKAIISLIDSNAQDEKFNEVKDQFTKQKMSKDFVDKTINLVKEYIALSKDKLSSNEIMEVEKDRTLQP